MRLPSRPAPLTALILIAVFFIFHSSDAQAQTAKPGRGKAAQARATVPPPREVIGFTPGDDRKLASWAQIVGYFKRLAQTSNRLLLEDLGKTTLGRPFVVATISSPANLAKLDRFKAIQKQL